MNPRTCAAPGCGHTVPRRSGPGRPAIYCRNPHLGEVLERSGLAERQAIGIDRMYVDMLDGGHPPPVITDDGLSAKVTLNGDLYDVAWLEMLFDLDQREPRSDVSILLLLDRRRSDRWVDIPTAAATIPGSTLEAETALACAVNLRRTSDGLRL